jgi:hypothetical protein
MVRLYGSHVYRLVGGRVLVPRSEIAVRVAFPHVVDHSEAQGI